MRISQCFFLVYVLVFAFVWAQIVIPPFTQRPADYAVNVSTPEVRPPMGANADNLFWFVQVTDLSLSTTINNSRRSDFESFLATTLPSIKPELVLVTGDIVQSVNNEGDTAVDLPAWRNYRDALINSGVLDPSHPCEFILDVQGEFDAFGMRFSPNGTTPFVEYASCGPYYRPNQTLATSPYTHKFVVQKPYGQYGFLGVDMYGSNPFWVTSPRQLSDDGDIRPQARADVRAFLEADPVYNGSILYMHPTVPSVNMVTNSFFDGTVLPSTRLNAILNGHLRKPNTYRHAGRALELSLNAWRKPERWYRLAAFDHDLLSFTDVSYTTTEVVILITNPKDARFLTAREPLHRMAQSTHVRALVFPTPAPGAPPIRIARVWAVFSNGTAGFDQLVEMTVANETGPLWVGAWSPAALPDGEVTVFVQYHALGNATLLTAAATQPYSTTGTSVRLPLTWSRLLFGLETYAFWTSVRVAMPVFFFMLILPPKFLLLFARRGGRREEVVEALRGDPDGVVLEFCIRVAITVQKQKHTPRTNYDGIGFTTNNIPRLVRYFWRELEGIDAYICLADSKPWWAIGLLCLAMPWVPWMIGRFQGNTWGLACAWGFVVRSGVFRGIGMDLFVLVYVFGFGTLFISAAHFLRMLTLARARRAAQLAAEEAQRRAVELVAARRMARRGRGAARRPQVPPTLALPPPAATVAAAAIPHPPRPSRMTLSPAKQPPAPRPSLLAAILRSTILVTTFLLFYAFHLAWAVIVMAGPGPLCWLCSPLTWEGLLGLGIHIWLVTALVKESKRERIHRVALAAAAAAATTPTPPPTARSSTASDTPPPSPPPSARTASSIASATTSPAISAPPIPLIPVPIPLSEPIPATPATPGSLRGDNNATPDHHPLEFTPPMMTPAPEASFRSAAPPGPLAALVALGPLQHRPVGEAAV
ncbi:putative transmembrane protein 62 [Paratrimastix pyriformis]|uniref:Transmembrane protein 62 n=1 Tax=Paratrimastix pyriformis TaxID=342808 RepID=A0ABQ8UV49_9EUKA|nr:putative transmembrane protein 62 [Paratrimastix pyriformis]